MKRFTHILAAGCAVLLAVAAAPQATVPAAPRLEAFANLPAPVARAGAEKFASRVHAGTAGLALAAPGPAAGSATVAILGSLAPDSPDRAKLLKMTVEELNLLRPDAVMTTGNLSVGLMRSGARYLEGVGATRGMLDELKMPWLPCAGATDVVSGTRLTSDRRFEELYQRYVGPLYFSVDIGSAEGGIHAITLDSEEGVGAGNTISDAQIAWLRQDLDRTFNLGRTQWVIVLLHRPLWRVSGERGNPGNWERVHGLLDSFNHRPIATVEGFGTAGTEARGPRVAAVFAGSQRAYAQDATRDGINYFVLGPTAAPPRDGESAEEAVRHFTLVKFDTDVHVSLVRLGGARDADAANILPADTVTAAERAVVDSVAGTAESVMGIDGVIDERGEPVGGGRRLTFHAENTLGQAIDVQLRIAAGNGWDFVSPILQRHLAPGEKAAYEFSLHRIKAGADWPALEVVVHWKGARGREHEVVLPRPVAVSPAVEVVTEKVVRLDGEEGWQSAPGGVAIAWDAEADRPRTGDPKVWVRADEEQVVFRVRVEDGAKSYWPVMALDRRWGGISSDAVAVSFVQGDVVQRIWAVPFGAKGVELFANAGTGEKETALVALDGKAGVVSRVKTDEKGYTVTVAVPRKMLMDEAGATTQPGPRLVACNVSVYDNNETARTWVKSWAADAAGVQGWARVTLVPPARNEK
jgi:hypothetical protein